MAAGIGAAMTLSGPSGSARGSVMSASATAAGGWAALLGWAALPGHAVRYAYATNVHAAMPGAQPPVPGSCNTYGHMHNIPCACIA